MKLIAATILVVVLGLAALLFLIALSVPMLTLSSVKKIETCLKQGHTWEDGRCLKRS